MPLKLANERHRHSRRGYGAGIRLLPLGMLALASACTNSLLSIRISGLTFGGGNGRGSFLITLVSVVRDSTDPSGTLDLIGDSSNAIGTYCTSPAGTSSNIGPSACTCVYSYTMPDGTSQSQEVATTYHEASLLHCLDTTIPSAVTTVNVSIHVLPQNAYSNTIPFNLTNSSPGFDTMSIANYAQVRRYTCRDIITVPNFFDSTVYDPFQSENPANSYPLDFYTTDTGSTLNAYAGGVAGQTPVTGWECPANPFNPPADNKVTVYSEAALSGDLPANAKIIAPTPATGGTFDRETFYLAQQPGGLFIVPVNAYIAPTIISSAANTVTTIAPPPTSTTSSPGLTETAPGIPPLGYGASPTSTGVPGNENCPDATYPIPRGYHWVKVWLFRMALPQRKYLVSNAFAQLGDISCYPGQLPNNGGGTNGGAPYPNPYSSTFPDCFGAPSLDGGAAIAARFFEGTAMCVQMAPGVGGGLFPQYDPAIETDLWHPNDQDVNFSCGKPNTIDPTHICTTSGGAGNGIGYDSNPQTAPIDNPDFTRYDFLFVVTPATVMSNQISDPTNPTSAQYTPYRFRDDADCGQRDPDAAGCNFTKAFRNYGIKFHDVGGNGDPPANDPSRPGVFPVCALQPN